MSIETSDLRGREPANRCPVCGSPFVGATQETDAAYVSGLAPPATLPARTRYTVKCARDHVFDVQAIQRYADGGYELGGLTRMR